MLEGEKLAFIFNFFVNWHVLLGHREGVRFVKNGISSPPRRLYFYPQWFVCLSLSNSMNRSQYFFRILPKEELMTSFARSDDGMMLSL